MEVIAIDLGSNSLQIVRYNCQKDEIINSFLKTVRTAQGLVETKRVSKEAIDGIIKALNEAKEKLNFSSAQAIVAVTTEAFRVALNAKEALLEIKDKTNIEFNIISPEQEAKLTLIAVKKRLEKLGIKKNFVLVDIGGGSTEVSFFIDGKIYSKSFKLGIVTTANSCKSLDEIKQFVEEKSKEIKEFTKEFDTKDLIFTATAGTPTTIAAMKHNLTYATYDAKVVTGTKLTINEVDYYLQKLLKMSKKEREIAVGVGRDDLIVAGVIIFKKLYEILNKQEAIVIDDGLAVGVAVDKCIKG